MTDPDEVVDLADLSADVVRARNDDIDAELSTKETRIDDLEQTIDEKDETIAEKDETIATLEDEKQATEELLREFEQAERAEAKERLAGVLPEDADLADEYVDNASVDQLHWMADVVEEATNHQPTQSSGGADLSQVQGENAASRKQELAKEMGMADAYEKAQSGQFDKPEGFEVNPEEDGQSANRAQLMEGLEEVLNG